MNEKLVYLFHEANEGMKTLLGGKGANLAQMTKAHLPVPPGFTITTSACNLFFENDQTLPDLLNHQMEDALNKLQESTDQILGDPKKPLLVSVRSGSVFSMPGMMDTILNLGLNDETAEGLCSLTQNPRFAYDSYRRFIQMYGEVVLGIDHYFFEETIQKYKEGKKAVSDSDLDAADWKCIIQQFKKIILEKTKKPLTQDPKEQLRESVRAVFRSWNNQRAKFYRKVNHIPDHLGTAVNIQKMVFGNKGGTSGTGVAFTRNPSTGENLLYGEYLVNAQGEDVVAGVRTPQSIDTLKEWLPEIYKEFTAVCNRLEKYYKDVQDIEFTVEEGKLYILQTRSGKRTAQAAVKIAVEMVEEGIISEKEALKRVDPEQLDQLLHPRFDEATPVTILAKGLPASPGAATGEIVFHADDAERKAKKGTKVILARPETTPEDIHGILSSQGILTTRGGMTSHAAVVARGMGKACVCGCELIKIDLNQKEMRIGNQLFHEGDVLSIDGSTGAVIDKEVPLIEPELTPEFIRLLAWADQVKRLQVRANADNPCDASKAKELGAEGIGLCRTEHMFMDAKRHPIVQKMILSETVEERMSYLSQLLPMQKQDFKEIFKEMHGFPVNIRLLDPPLHEFLPSMEEIIKELCGLDKGTRAYKEKEALLVKVRSLHEFNPMLGHRGCRLGIVSKEIYECQLHAIFEAACEGKEEGITVGLELMIPLVGHVNELQVMRDLVDEVASHTFQKMEQSVSYQVGTMIEVPRACLTAAEISKVADFFSFGTNDLTQMTFGYSRDDAEGKFLHYYLDHQILQENPFIALDQEGVGSLIRMGVEEGRRTKPTLKTGVCGEHGGEKTSIHFFHQSNVDYVSCSPYRIPLARLACAQAVLSEEGSS